MVLVGVGQGLVGPSVSGLLSRLTPASEQGAVFGTLSSAQTLARMISYSTANLLLGRVSTAAPYWFGFAVYLGGRSGGHAVHDSPASASRGEPAGSGGPVGGRVRRKGTRAVAFNGKIGVGRSEIAVQVTTDPSRIGIAMASHHRGHCGGMIEQDLNGFDQSLRAGLEQPVQEELANLDGL